MLRLVQSIFIRAIKSTRFLLFVSAMVLIFCVYSFLIAKTTNIAASVLPSGVEIPQVPYSSLPVQFGAIWSLSFSFVFVFGAPFICGDFIAIDRRSKLWDVYRSRGISNFCILASYIISFLIIVLMAGIFTFGLGLLISRFFFNGSCAEIYSRKTLIDMTLYFYPQIAQISMLLYWAIIIFIYTIMAWGVLCLCALLGIALEQPLLAMSFPAALLVLVNEFTYDAQLSRMFCYMCFDFPLYGWCRWRDLNPFTIQLPIIIGLFIFSSFMVLKMKTRKD